MAGKSNKSILKAKEALEGQIFEEHFKDYPVPSTRTKGTLASWQLDKIIVDVACRVKDSVGSGLEKNTGIRI